MGLTWYNFRTGEYDYLEETPLDLADYIPQSPAAQNMYALLVGSVNVLPSDAALQVLAASVPPEMRPNTIVAEPQ